MSSSQIQPGKGVRTGPNKVQQAYVNVSLVLSPDGMEDVVASLIVRKVNGGRDDRTCLFFSRVKRVGPTGRLLPISQVLLAAVQDLPVDL